MKDNKIGLVQAIGSLGFVFTFCGYVSGYGYFGALIRHLFVTSAPITSFMTWDLILARGVSIIFWYLMLGLSAGVGVFAFRLKKRQRGVGSWGSTYNFDSASVKRALYISVYLILFGGVVSILKTVAGLQWIKNLQMAKLLLWILSNLLVGFTVSYILYYVWGVFYLTEEKFERIKSSLITITLTAFLLYTLSGAIGQFESILLIKRKAVLGYPKINLVTKSEFPELKEIKTFLNPSIALNNYEVNYFSFKDNSYFVIDERTLTIHAIPREKVETFWFLPRQRLTTYVGIGITMFCTGDLITVIEEPQLDTPAKKAGINKGDQIISINGTSTIGLTIDEATSMIRGPEGSTVILEIKRHDSDEIFKAEIIRETIKSKLHL